VARTFQERIVALAPERSTAPHHCTKPCKNQRLLRRS
jgi:hypothetical protein